LLLEACEEAGSAILADRIWLLEEWVGR
jgi:hypothetical protein